MSKIITTTFEEIGSVNGYPDKTGLDVLKEKIDIIWNDPKEKNVMIVSCGTGGGKSTIMIYMLYM